MDAFELMRAAPEFASFFTSGVPISTDGEGDEEEDDLEQELELGPLRKKKKKSGDNPEAMIVIGLDTSYVQSSSSDDSFTASTPTTPVRAKKTISSSSLNKVKNNKAKNVLDEIVQKNWKVQEVDPFAMGSDILEEMNKIAREDAAAKAAKAKAAEGNSSQQKEVAISSGGIPSSTSTSTSTSKSSAMPSPIAASKSAPSIVAASSSTSTTTSSNATTTTTTPIPPPPYHHHPFPNRRRPLSKEQAEEKSRRLMLQLEAIEHAYTTDAVTIVTPSFSPVKAGQAAATSSKTQVVPSSSSSSSITTTTTPLSPPIATRIIPERRSATRAIASIKQEAMSEKAIERFVKQSGGKNVNSSAQQQNGLVLATKSSAARQSALTSAVNIALQKKPTTASSKTAKTASKGISNSTSKTSSSQTSSSQTSSPSSSPPPTAKGSLLKGRPRRYATEEERKAAIEAAKERYKDNETPEQRAKRLKRLKVHRLMGKGRFEEALEFAAEEGLVLSAAQQEQIAEALDSKTRVVPPPTRKKKSSTSPSSSSSSTPSASKDIQIISTKKKAAEAAEATAKDGKSSKKRTLESSENENEAPKEEKKKAVTSSYSRLYPPKKAKVTHAYFGVDRAWDQLVIAQEVAKTTVTRAGRQCKAKNWND